MHREQQDKLLQSVVRVHHGTTVGTGFFVGSNASLLTCLHAVRNNEAYNIHGTCKLTSEALVVTFNDIEYPAKCVYTSPDPQTLDVAVLRLTDGKLPPGAILLPLGEWEAALEKPREFRTFGFRSPDSFKGLHAGGLIRGRTFAKSGIPLLQLASEAIGEVEIRRGMSGAPVYHEATGQIVGMITSRYQEGRIIDAGTAETPEIIPLAVPIEALRDIPDIKVRLWERELVRVLDAILHSAWFTEEMFRTLYETLPIQGLKKYVALGDDKPKALLDQLKGEQVLDLFRLLRAIRPDIALDRQVELPPIHRLHFVNREDERREACERYAPQYIFFEAPAGYGKTELLKAIEQQHFRDGWLCIYVKTPEGIASALELAQHLARQGRLMSAAALSDIEVLGTALAVAIAEKWADKTVFLDKSGRPRVLFLIDNVERLPQSEIAPFLNRFLPSVQEVLPGLRVRLAGRYVGSEWIKRARALKLAEHPLTPFKFKYVRDTVESLLPFQQEADLDLYAAHLMYTTGGHPGCMAQIIECTDLTQPVEEYFIAHQDKHKDIVLPVAHRIRESIPRSLRDICDALSVFRRYNYRILQRIIDAGLIDQTGDVDSLEKALTATYLMKRKRDGFIQDEIVRRLLAIRLRWEEHTRFIRLCENARQIYEQDLQGATLRPDQIALETLYQELQLRYFRSSQTLGERKALRKEFLADSGILNRYLQVLAPKPNASDILADLQVCLEDEDGDWEFHFVVNFYLRGVRYCNEPYVKIMEQVRAVSV